MEITFTISIIILIIFIYRQFVPRLRIFRYSWMKGYFAHRGLYTIDQKIVENSLTSFKEAIKHGYGIELDISLSKDQKCMVFHDDSLSRICHINNKISDIDSSILNKLKLMDSDDTIPYLFEVLNLVNGQVPLMIELKTHKQAKDLVILFKEVMKDYQGDYCVVSFDPIVLFYLKKFMPDIIRGQIVEDFRQKKEYPFILRMMLHYALFNFVNRPDFLSYKYSSINVTYKVHRSLKGFGAIWALNSLNLEKDFQNDANCIIFEHYHP